MKALLHLDKMTLKFYSDEKNLSDVYMLVTKYVMISFSVQWRSVCVD